jgi:hypothetical protein
MLRHGTIKPDAIATGHRAGAGSKQMLLYVVRGKQAVTVDEQQVRRLALSNAIVSASGSMKANVSMRDKTDWERRSCGEIVHQAASLIGRAVISNDDFQSARGSLDRDRFQNAAHVPGHLVRRHDDRHVRRLHREVFHEFAKRGFGAAAHRHGRGMVRGCSGAVNARFCNDLRTE